MKVSLTSKGDFSKTKQFFGKLMKAEYLPILEECGQQGVYALQQATPKDTGMASYSWSYAIERRKGYTTIVWTNSDVTKQGDPIVLLLQYGHGTGTGGYVQGRDFINPTMKPMFDLIADKAWKAVTGE